MYIVPYVIQPANKSKADKSGPDCLGHWNGKSNSLLLQ